MNPENMVKWIFQTAFAVSLIRVSIKEPVNANHELLTWSKKNMANITQNSLTL